MGETFFTSMKLVNLAPTTEESTSYVMEQKDEISVDEIEVESDFKYTPSPSKDRHIINHLNIDMDAFLARLKSSIERVYQTVMPDMSINLDDLEVAIELTENNTIVPTHNCLICRKLLKISYDTRKGKLKQFFTGNMKKHLIKMHTPNCPVEAVKPEFVNA